MLYRPTVRDETNNAENVWKKSTAFIHSVMRTGEHTHVLYFTSKYVAVIAEDLKWAMAIDRFSRAKIQHSAVRVRQVAVGCRYFNMAK